VWLDIGIKKVDTHKGITVKALLDSGATGMFMDREMAKRHGFKMTKLERPLKVKNVDRTENSRGNIMHQVEVNVFYKNHMERMRMDVCNLGKIEIILLQTSFGHISINSLTVFMVSMATESP